MHGVILDLSLKILEPEILIPLVLFERQVSQRQKKRVKSSIHRLTSPMSTAARAELTQSQEPRVFSGSTTWVQGSNYFSNTLLHSQALCKRAARIWMSHICTAGTVGRGLVWKDNMAGTEIQISKDRRRVSHFNQRLH